MRIVLRCPEEPKEWFLIELQGTLSFNESQSSEPLHTRPFGQFFWKNGKPFIVIGDGQYELEGEEVILKKPLIVVNRVEKNTLHSDVMTGNETCTNTFSSQDRERVEKFDFNCIAVIRKKFLFTKRPRLIFRS